MAIKNKDGTVFKISGPNPLMDEQTLWDGFTKHNFEWSEEIDKENKNKVFEIKQNKEDVLFEEKKIVIEEPKIIEKKEEEKKVEVKEQKNISDHKTIQCFCLPAKTIEKKDELYEETYQRVEYLDKFIFDAVVIEKADIYIKFWTMEKITKNSIVYPKNKDKRWWKVSDQKEAPMGFIYIAMISDYTPSFE
jgi:hypothetical protein